MVRALPRPSEWVQMVNYTIAGVTPIATAQELVDMVIKRIPDAIIDFDPDLALLEVIEKLLLPIDDRYARKEWNWKPEYDQERIIDDFLEELKLHPERYA